MVRVGAVELRRKIVTLVPAKPEVKRAAAKPLDLKQIPKASVAAKNSEVGSDELATSKAVTAEGGE